MKTGAAQHEHSLDNNWFCSRRCRQILTPGPNEPSGFILTTILGIVGAVVASYLGQALGFYGPGEGAGIVGAIIGAVVVLVVWSLVAKNRAH